MALKSHVRVELRKDVGGDFKDRDRAFRSMFSAFKRQVNNAGILTEYNQRESYESRSQKKRRKLKESALRRNHEALQTRLREHFGQG
jgi:ribosomal protein S21